MLSLAGVVKGVGKEERWVLSDVVASVEGAGDGGCGTVSAGWRRGGKCGK